MQLRRKQDVGLLFQISEPPIYYVVILQWQKYEVIHTGTGAKFVSPGTKKCGLLHASYYQSYVLESQTILYRLQQSFHFKGLAVSLLCM